MEQLQNGNNRREQGFAVLLPIHNLNFRVVTR
jgi:hypothetical protein